MSDKTLDIAKEPRGPSGVNYRPIFKSNPVLEEFRGYLVPHCAYTDCEREILRRINGPGGANVLTVVGPTGAGKTEMLNQVASVLLDAPDPKPTPSLGAMGLIRPYLPVVYVTAPTGVNFRSRFRGLLIEILKQVNRVVTDAGMVRAINAVDRQRKESLQRVSIPRLEELVRGGLRARRTRVVLIDEGQHLAMSPNAKDWLMVAESLKVLGSISGTLIVLFGTSELLCLPSLSGQLGRRTRAIHLRRYRWDIPGDQSAFIGVVSVIANAWPEVLPEKLLLDNLELIYAGCVGCVGILFDWLHDAMVLAEGETVTMEVLLEAALPEKRLRKIDCEARDCEKAFERKKGGLASFAKELCESAGGNGSTQPPAAPVQAVQGAKKTRRGRVRRNPTYDPYQPVVAGTQ